MRRIKRKIVTLLCLALMVTSQAFAGWQPVDEDGWMWELHVPAAYGNTMVVARCYYTGIIMKGMPLWNGVYYNKLSDWWGSSNGFFDDFTRASELEGAYGCVQWVNHFLIGDYYL